MTLVTSADGREHWCWHGFCDAAGYGQTTIHGKAIGAHRLSYTLYKNQGEKIAPELHVRHIRCRFRNCINPDCLELGTAQENALDKIADGTIARGEKNGNTKIDEVTALAIKNSRGEGTQYDRAKRFAVTVAIVRNIDSGECWAHL